MGQVIDYGEKAEKPKEEIVEQAPIVSLASARGSSPKSIQRALRKSADPLEMLKAVTEANSPSEVTHLLKKAIRYAEEQKSWYGILEVLRFQMEYAVGKPVQRSVSATLNPEDFAKFFED